MGDQQQDVGAPDDAPLARAAARRSGGVAREQDADGAGQPVSSGSSPGPVEQGTAARNPVAGREINAGEAAAAVERSPEE